MKPKLIALNILLVLAMGAIVWQARARWSETQSKRREKLSVKVKPLVPLNPMVVGLKAAAMVGGAAAFRLAEAVAPMPPLLELTLPVVTV